MGEEKGETGHAEGGRHRRRSRSREHGTSEGGEMGEGGHGGGEGGDWAC